MIWTMHAAAALLLALNAVHGDAAVVLVAQDTVRLRPPVRCDQCRLMLDTNAIRIGGPRDDLGITWVDVILLDVIDSGHVLLAPSQYPGTVHRYSRSHMAEQLARRGDGPNEFRDIIGIHATGPGTAWIYGGFDIRHVQVTGDQLISGRRSLMKLSIYHLLQISERRLAINAWGIEAGGVNTLLIAELDSNNVVVAQRPVPSYRVSPSLPRATSHASMALSYFRSEPGTFLVASPSRIAISQVDSLGRTSRVFTYDPRWFAPWTSARPAHRVSWMSNEVVGAVSLAIEVPCTMWDSGHTQVDLGRNGPGSGTRCTMMVAIDLREQIVIGEWLLPVRLMSHTPAVLGLWEEAPGGEITIFPVTVRVTR